MREVRVQALHHPELGQVFVVSDQYLVSVGIRYRSVSVVSVHLFNHVENRVGRVWNKKLLRTVLAEKERALLPETSCFQFFHKTHIFF